MKRPYPAHALSLPFLVLGQQINPSSCDVVELEGSLDARLLTEAVRRATRRHPVLAGEFQHQRFGKVWTPKPFFEPKIRFLRLVKYDPALVQRVVLDNAWLGPTSSELVRVFVIEAGKRTFFQICSPHGCTDARAGARLAQDIADSYTALENKTPWDDSVIDVADRSLAALFPEFAGGTKALSHVASGVRMVLDSAFEKPSGLKLPSVRRGPTQLHKVKLPAQFLGRLSLQAKHLGTTVHPLLCLAVLRAREDFNRARGARNTPFRFVDLYNMRRHAAVDINDLYDVMVAPHVMELNAGDSDQAVIRSIQDQVSALRNGGIFASIMQKALFASLPLSSELLVNIGSRICAHTNIAVTNPGRVPYPLERFGSVPIVDFYNFPQLFPPCRLLLIFTTFRDELRLLVTYDEHSFPSGIDSLVAMLRRRLDELAPPGLQPLRHTQGALHAATPGARSNADD